MKNFYRKNSHLKLTETRHAGFEPKTVKFIKNRFPRIENFTHLVAFTYISTITKKFIRVFVNSLKIIFDYYSKPAIRILYKNKIKENVERFSYEFFCLLIAKE